MFQSFEKPNLSKSANQAMREILLAGDTNRLVAELTFVAWKKWTILDWQTRNDFGTFYRKVSLRWEKWGSFEYKARIFV